MTIKVGILGGDRIARRLADAVAAQSDMQVSGVTGWERTPHLAEQRQYRLIPSSEQLAEQSDVLLDTTLPQIRLLAKDWLLSGQLPEDELVVSGLTDIPASRSAPWILPFADAVGLTRILESVLELSPIERLFLTLMRRAGHAADVANASLDALQPTSGPTPSLRQLEGLFSKRVGVCLAREVIVPYTHSHLHIVKMDLAGEVDRDAIVATLRESPRILVAAATEGFHSTADVNEFFRDVRQLRGDRWEVFVWEDSILSIGRSVYLTLDLSPDAVLIPEAIDAVRMMLDQECEISVCRQQTDDSLGIRECWERFPHGRAAC